jgi:hypothetical protein
MFRILPLLLAILMAVPLPAAAFQRIATRDAFLALVEGRTLVGDGVSLDVAADGGIRGRGFGLRVSGSWTWEDGFFCRTLETLIRDFPRDCQTVARRGDVLRFTAERGTGAVADLRMR